MPVSVLIADDHLMLREAISNLLDPSVYDVIARAENGKEAVRLAAALHPDLALLDVLMPEMDGIQATREIKRLSPSTKVVLLTVQEDDRTVLEAVKSGVSGYVLKSEAPKDLLRTMEDALAGGVGISSRLMRPVVDTFVLGRGADSDPLTTREKEVLRHIADGETTKEVAVQLGISVKTAESHRARMMEKLDIHETATLVRYAIRTGLVQA